MIEFSCPKCLHPIQVQDEAAGKKGKCKQCGASITVPTLEEETEAISSLPDLPPSPPPAFETPCLEK